MKKTYLFITVLLFLSLGSKAQSPCDSIIPCDSINQAITELGNMYINDSARVYSEGLLSTYVSIRFPQYTFSTAQFDSAIVCCGISNVDLADTVTSDCDFLAVVDVDLKLGFPSDECRPFWFYDMLLTSLIDQNTIPYENDSTIEQFNAGLTGCGLKTITNCPFKTI